MIAESGTESVGEVWREHVEFLDPLLDRMEEIAAQLDVGIQVPPELVAEGIALWSEYGHAIHDGKVDRLIVREGATAAKSRCEERLSEIQQERTHWPQRHQMIEQSLAEYAEGKSFGGAHLALALRNAAHVDREWTRFEEEFPFSCLAERPLGEAGPRIIRESEGSEARARELEARINRFLALPYGPVVPPERWETLMDVTCTHPSCRERCLARVVAGPDGRPDVRLLEPGWSFTLRPEAAGESPKSHRIDFRCPAHRILAPPARPATSGTRGRGAAKPISLMITL